MVSENVYRWLVLALLCGSMSVGIRFRLRAARGGRVSRRGEGPLILYGLRACGLTFWAALLIYLVRPSALEWAAMALPDWARLAGLPLGLASVAWTAWTFATLGRNLTDTVAVRESAYLVTAGPYRWVRHPFYVGVALVLVAVTLLTDNGLLGALGVAVLGFLAARTPIEERQLIARFGDDYRVYAARTHRFWPRRPAPEPHPRGS